jgi:uncharacterized membrane protein YhaH (DUF805 family)
MRLPRLRRGMFWCLSIAVWLVFFVVRESFMLERRPLVATAWAAITLLVIATSSVARLHDRGRSGWWLATALVPVAGALWLFWELALRRGDAHANAWGEDPRSH